MHEKTSMLTIRGMAGGVGYAERHLEHNDYYAEGRRIAGEWRGRGARLLRLAGKVQRTEFEAARRGEDPTGGAYLRPRLGADRMKADGTIQSHAKTLYDMAFSAPKSVSILALVGGDDRLVEAHRQAVEAALQEVEEYASTRVRMRDSNENRMTGNMVIALYHHDTSRALDPQLHSHAVAANLTFDGAENRWKALQMADIFERCAYLTEVYRNDLAMRARALGYEVEGRRDAKAQDRGFEIKGVPEALLEKFSRRSQQRDLAVADFAEQQGRAPTKNEVSVLVRNSRPDKLQEISPEQVRGLQCGMLTPEEGEQLRSLHTQALSNERGPNLGDAWASLNHAKDHVFERASVVKEHTIYTEALRYGRGQVPLGALKAEFERQRSSRELLVAGGEAATRASLARELEMIERINAGLGAFESLGSTREFQIASALRPEQRRAVEFVLDSKDFAINIQGAAGTGKTRMLQELDRGLSAAGRPGLAVAPTRSAVQELENAGFRQAMTIERLLQDERAQACLGGRVLIVDEAGMVSGRQMSALLELSSQHSARIVFCGDTRQIQSVEASDALRILEQESGMRSVSLQQVQRQSQLDYRRAMELLRSEPDKGFDALLSSGRITEIAGEERPAIIAAEYRSALVRPTSSGRRADVLVVCSTHAEIQRVTAAIRLERQRAGELRSGTVLTRHESLNWTEAQKRDFRNYRAGQVLEFHRAVAGVGKDESLEVMRIEPGRMVAKSRGGEEIVLTARHTKAFSVYECQAIEVSASDRLLLTANRRASGFRATNGELVTVKNVAGNGQIELEDGRTVPGDYRQFNHGYAVTAHRSQGKTVDRVIISADRMKRELFYVAASRGREELRIVTSDCEALREWIGRSGARKSATELARETDRTQDSKANNLRKMYRSESSHLVVTNGQKEISQMKTTTPQPIRQRVPHISQIGAQQEFGDFGR